MPTSIYKDPFSLVYKGLWELVDRNNNLDRLVPAGNRIRYDNPAPDKDVISDADTPELSLMRSSTTFDEKTNSSGTGLKAVYTWAIASGSLEIEPVFNPITFELFRSMVDYKCVLCSLQWCDCSFVQDLKLLSSQEATRLQDVNRGLEGWASLLEVEVEMFFQFTKLKLS